MTTRLRSIQPILHAGETRSSSTMHFPKAPVYGSTVKKTKALTAQQALRLAYAKGQAHPHRSLLGKGLHAATHGLETAMDIIMRPSYGIAEGVREATDNKPGGFAHGFGQGFHGHAKTGFGQVLAEHSGFFRHHKVLRAISGLGLDIATDPTNLLMLAAAPETGGGSLAPLLLKGATKEEAVGLMKTAKLLREGKLGKVAAMNAEKDFAKHPDIFGAHRELARHTYRRLAAQAAAPYGSPLEDFSKHAYSGYQAFAHAEHAALVGDKKLALHAILPFGHKWAGRGSLALPLPLTKAPTLSRISEGKGILGKIPFSKGMANTIGKAFKPGWGNEKFHALERVSLRTGEQLNETYLKDLEKMVAPQARKLTTKQQIDALDKAVSTKGLIVTKARHLSGLKLDKMIRDGKITKDQGEFIKAWHGFTEHMRLQDKDYGIPYDSMKGVENKIYVPHMYTKDALKVQPNFGRSYMTKQGFQYERAFGPNMDDRLAALKKLHENGAYNKELETDPMVLLQNRTRRGATSHANSIMQHVIAASEGVPEYLPNAAKLAELTNEKRAILKKQAGLKTFDEHAALARAKAEGWLHENVLKEVDRHVGRMKEIKRNYNKFQKRAARANKRPAASLPTHSALVKMKPKELAALKKRTGKRLGVGIDNLLKHHALVRHYERRLRLLSNKTGIYGARTHGSNFKAELEKMLNEFGVKDKSILTKKMVKNKDGTAETWEQRLRTEIQKARHDNVRAWDDLLKSKGIKKGGVPFRAHMGAQRAARVRELEAHQNKLADLEHRSEAHLTRHMLKAERDYGVAERKGVAYQRRLDKIESRLEYHQKSLKNPEVEKRGLEPVDRLRADNGSRIALPPELKGALERVRRISADDELQQEFGRTWQQWIGRWKVWATVMNPGYRVRNTLSDVWNMYVSGMPMWAIPTYGGKAAKLMVAVNKGDPKALHVWLEAYDHGILSGLFQGDVAKIAERLRGKGSVRELAQHGHALQALQKGMTDINRNAENFGRLAHYLYRRDYEKLGAAEAAEKVKAAHFDYEDLTPTERKIKSSVIPFYTWTRKNIPFQITQLVSRPGRYAGVPKMMNEFNQASGKPPGPSPAWMQQQLAFHVPFGGAGNMMMTQFGPIDIEKLQHPTQMFGMVSPPIKAAAELGLNKSFLTGAPIYGKDTVHPRNPVSGLAAAVLSQIPGSNVGQTSRNVRGKNVSGPGASPLFTYLAGQVPAANLLVSARSNIKQTQRGGKVGPLSAADLSELAGISTYQPDVQAEQTARRTQMETGFKQFLKGLRDEGRYPQTKKKKSKYDKSLDKVLAGG